MFSVNSIIRVILHSDSVDRVNWVYLVCKPPRTILRQYSIICNNCGRVPNNIVIADVQKRFPTGPHIWHSPKTIPCNWSNRVVGCTTQNRLTIWSSVLSRYRIIMCTVHMKKINFLALLYVYVIKYWNTIKWHEFQNFLDHKIMLTYNIMFYMYV